MQRGKRKVSDETKKGDYKKIRGKLSARTCPKCKRVFTSTLGLKYHVDKNVCASKVAASKVDAAAPMPTLLAGMKFVTKYGVVEVVADNRATPNAVLCDNIKEEMKKYTSSRAQHERKLQQFRHVNTVKNLAKRVKLSDLYQTGGISQASVFQASIHVSHPMMLASTGDCMSLFVAPTIRSDPCEPKGCCPDRIVECIVISDERQRFLGDGDDDHSQMETRQTGLVGCKMYLQRRLLMTPYVEQQCLYSCQNCGQEFASRPGIKYHQSSKICINKAKKAMESRKHEMTSLRNSLDDPAIADEHLMRRQLPSSRHTMNRSNMLPEAYAPKRVFRRKKDKLVVNVSVYPQVYLALGIKLLPRSVVATKETTVSAFRKPSVQGDETFEGGQLEVEGAANVVLSWAPGPRVSKSKQTSSKSQGEMNPRFVLADLERQLRLEMARNLGPVYDFAFKSLGYKKTKTNTKKRKHKPAKPPAPIRKKRRENVPKAVESTQTASAIPTDAISAGPNVPHNHRLLAIDMCVLIDEVEAGRYPSMKRNGHDVEHELVCFLCKAEETDSIVYQCQFCPRSVHWACMRTRYLVKEPELDDFMCCECINYIHHRRKRAEKRRLDKLGLSEQADDETDPALLTSVIRGREYDCLMAQGNRVAELTELLADSRKRLSQCLEISKMDEQRYAVIESAERDAQFIPMTWD